VLTGKATRAAVPVVLAVTLAACSPSSSDGGVRVSTAGSTVSSALGVGVTSFPLGARPSIPDIAGATLDGPQLALSTLRGHVVVLNVWASWCEPCRSESPLLARVSAATAASGVRFVGVDEQDRADAARTFSSSAGTTYPHVQDPDGSLLRSLRLVPSSGIPSTLVLDESGAVAARVIGPVDPATFQALVESVTRQTPVASPR
jgi:thiol-disulfide isomerase/thioredoxin